MNRAGKSDNEATVYGYEECEVLFPVCFDHLVRQEGTVQAAGNGIGTRKKRRGSEQHSYSDHASIPMFNYDWVWYF